MTQKHKKMDDDIYEQSLTGSVSNSQASRASSDQPNHMDGHSSSSSIVCPHFKSSIKTDCVRLYLFLFFSRFLHSRNPLHLVFFCCGSSFFSGKRNEWIATDQGYERFRQSRQIVYCSKTKVNRRKYTPKQRKKKFNKVL